MSELSKLRSALFSFILLTIPSLSQAVQIEYQHADLADITVGQDLWRSVYTVSGLPFSVDTGFSIYFDPTLYAGLVDSTVQATPDWDILVLQPDTSLPADGLLDALALVDNPALSTLFTVDYVWLGVGTPGRQSFDVYDATFSIVESGMTQPPAPVGTVPPIAVPEPPVLSLVFLGLVALISRSRARKI